MMPLIARGDRGRQRRPGNCRPAAASSLRCDDDRRHAIRDLPDQMRRVVADAAPGNWVDRRAPLAWRPYLRLARADRRWAPGCCCFPAGGPRRWPSCRWGSAYPNLWYALLFAIGAFVMRGAGCAYNDIVDRDYDAGVARTRSRPIPSGQVSVAAAKAFMVALCLAGPGRPDAVQPLHGCAGHRVAGAGCDLSVHEAVHLLAAAHPRPDLQVGRAGGLGRRHGRARLARARCCMRAASSGPSATTRSTPTRTRRTTRCSASSPRPCGSATPPSPGSWRSMAGRGRTVGGRQFLAGAGIDRRRRAGRGRRCTSAGRSERSISPIRRTALSGSGPIARSGGCWWRGSIADMAWGAATGGR